MKVKNISIVIPNWNGRLFLEKNLPKVIRAAKDAEVIVVDDFSQDESVIFLKANYPHVKLVLHKKNKGFGETCNDGVNEATGGIVVLLNSDVAPEENFLEALARDFTDMKVFAVGCGEISSGPGKMTFRNGNLELKATKRSNSKCPAIWVSGGQSAFSKKIWGELGGFDDLFSPFYWEDIDLCYRAWKRGYKVFWDPKSVVTHAHEGVIDSFFQKEEVEFIGQRNQLLFIWKNVDDPKFLSNHILFLIKNFLKGPGYFKVIWAALLKLPKVIFQRWQEKRTRKIADKDLLQKFDEIF